MLGVSETTALVQGLVSFFSPCVLPLLPVYFSILGLRAGNQIGQRRGWLFYNGLSFCLGLSVIFIAL